MLNCGYMDLVFDSILLDLEITNWMATREHYWQSKGETSKKFPMKTETTTIFCH